MVSLLSQPLRHVGTELLFWSKLPAGLLLTHSQLSFEKAKESWEMGSKEKLEQSSIVKERGTLYFKEGKHKEALLQYEKTVSWLEHVSSFSVEEMQKVHALQLASHLHLALCYLKLQAFAGKRHTWP